MAKKDYDALSVQLLQEVGGPDNIAQVYHCITRLRFSLKVGSCVDFGQRFDGFSYAASVDCW